MCVEGGTVANRLEPKSCLRAAGTREGGLEGANSSIFLLKRGEERCWPTFDYSVQSLRIDLVTIKRTEIGYEPFKVIRGERKEKSINFSKARR